MKGKIDFFEVKRQIVHIILGILIIVLVNIGILNVSILGFITALGLIISILAKFRKIPIISWFLERFERPNNLTNFPGKGALFFVMGCFFSLALFKENVAFASIMILTLGDSFSTLVGKYFGKTKIPIGANNTKSFEGTIFGIIIATLGANIFLNNWFWSFAGSFIGMVMESFDVRLGKYGIDDNLIIPLAAGGMIALLIAL